MRSTRMFAAAIGVVLMCGGCSNSTTTSPTATTTSPVTESFASQIAPHGSAAHTFVVQTGGTVKVTLTSFGNGTVATGVGVGISGTGAPCSLAQSTITVPGDSPQIVTTADAGAYCVQVFDTGTINTETSFSLTIEHP